MKNQNDRQEILLSEEGENLGEGELEKVTGGMQSSTGIPPFDSGSASTAPAADKVLKVLPEASAADAGNALEKLNQLALHGHAWKAEVAPGGEIILKERLK